MLKGAETAIFQITVEGDIETAEKQLESFAKVRSSLRHV
jgi:hypothetical protein